MSAAFFLLLISHDRAYANLVFPAIAQQFMVSGIIPAYWSIVMAALILIIETVFIKKLLLLNLFFSFLTSFAVNLLSSVCGIIIVSMLPIHLKGNILSYGNMRLGTYIGLLPGYILTVCLEGLLLIVLSKIVLKKVKKTTCMRTSMIMNLLSYAVLLMGIFTADILTHGQNFVTF